MSTERLTKLLRVACSNGPDGEKLAALNRISAILQANSLDWPQLLNNSSQTASLSEAQMQRIYNEGYQRGLQDGQRSAQPEADWTDAKRPTKQAGKHFEYLRITIEKADEVASSYSHSIFSDFEREFIDSMLLRILKYGDRTYISPKQWKVVDKIHSKLQDEGYLDV